MILLHPGNLPGEAEFDLTPRAYATLDGLRLGLLGNSKLNADNVLNAIGDLLNERYTIVSTHHMTKPSFSHPAPAEIVEEMSRNCDVVIAGVGD
jgi:hypothetical protein